MRNQWEESRSGVREREYEPRKQSAELLVSYFILSLSSQDSSCKCEFQSFQMACISSLELKATFSLRLYNCRCGGFTFRLIQVTATKMTVGRKHSSTSVVSSHTSTDDSELKFLTGSIFYFIFKLKTCTFSQEMLQKHLDCIQHHSIFTETKIIHLLCSLLQFVNPNLFKEEEAVSSTAVFNLTFSKTLNTTGKKQDKEFFPIMSPFPFIFNCFTVWLPKVFVS